MTALRTIAHARTGDKGDAVNISVIAYRQEDYARLERHVTAERIRAHFAAKGAADVVRYALPQLGALNFLIQNVLAGGVTRSLAVDAHGKSLSSFLLDMEIPDEHG